MSFGIGIGDGIRIFELTKDVIDRCRKAPEGFADAGRSANSIRLILENIIDDAENNPSSIFANDREQVDKLNYLLLSCEEPLRRLNDILRNFESLGTDHKKVLDRVRFPRKDVVDIRGLLLMHVEDLKGFLLTVETAVVG